MGETPVGPRVQQFLFGYEDGHKLLAGSSDLPGRVARHLLVSGDFAVPAERSGRYPYLTGAPIDELSAYALSGTWPAPEMRRPGCVWTHTLLIGFADLAHLDDLGRLAGLLRRPGAFGSWLGGYADALSIPPGMEPSILPKSEVVEPLLNALYLEPTKRWIVFSATDGDVDATLALWSQQWPRLRRTFRFASRAGGYSRGMSDRTDDLLLLIGEQSLRHAQTMSGMGSDSRTGDGSIAEMDEPVSWLSDAVADASGQSDGSLRAFLRRYGADVTGGRTAFAGLADAYGLTSGRTASAAKFGRLLVDRFRAASEAGKLKADLFAGRLGGIDVDATERLRWVDEMEAAAPGAMRTIDESHVRDLLNQVVTKAGSEPLFAVLESGASSGHGVWRDLIIETLARRTSPARALARLGPTSSYAALAEYDLAFVEFAAAWRHPGLAKLLLETGLRLGCPSERIMTLAVGMDDEPLAALAADRLGPVAVKGVIEAFERGRQPGDAWLSMLKASGEALAIGMESSTPIKARTVSALLDVVGNSAMAQAPTAAHWAAFTRTMSGQLSKRERMPVAARLFAIAVMRPGPGSEELLARTFELVHEAAADGWMDASTWETLEEHVPGRWAYWYWDRCERLRCATCQAFVRVGGESWRFLDLTTRRRTFEALVRTLRHVTDGAAFVRDLRRTDRLDMSTNARRNLLLLEKL